MKLSFQPGATPLDPDEAAGLIPSSVSTMAELNEFEQANILSAQEWVLRQRTADLLSDAFIRKLHQRMLGEVWKWAGTYRTSNKSIGVEWPQIRGDLQKLCADARFWMERQIYGWDELGARFHHRLVLIHPFANGNGRHARLLTDALLIRHGQPLFSWGASKSLGNPVEVRARYIAALQDADQKRFGPLIAFVRA